MTSTAIAGSAHDAAPAFGADRHRRRRSRSRSRLLVASLLYVAVVLVVTLGPQPLDSGRSAGLATAIELLSAATHLDVGYSDVEFLANVAMFVPFGVLVALWLARRHCLIALASGFVMSAGVEIAQIFIPGRVADTRDLVANTIGTMLGIALLAASRPAAARTSGSSASTRAGATAPVS